MASSKIETKNWNSLGNMSEGQYIQIPDDAVEVYCIEFSSTYNSYSGSIILTPFKTVIPNSYFRFNGMTIHLDKNGGNLRVSQAGMIDTTGAVFTAPVYVYYR